MRIIAFWDLCGGLPILGNYHMTPSVEMGGGEAGLCTEHR